jgi:hypothetical protein
MKRILLAGAAAVAALGFVGLGTAHADGNDGPHRWCPGQSMEYPTGPFNAVVWDMNVCHTWTIVGYQNGNLPLKYNGTPSNIWEGDNPPAWAPPPPCPPIGFMCP